MLLLIALTACLGEASDASVPPTCPPPVDACHPSDVMADDNGDGNVDRRSLYAWADGELTDELHDADFDGVWEDQRQTDFDAAGRVIRATVDWGGDGVLDQDWVHTWQEVGPAVVHVVRDAVSGVVERIETLTLDADGQEVERAVDLGGDGTVEERVFTERDGAWVRVGHDGGADGVIDAEIETRTDAEGRVVEQRSWNLGAPMFRVVVAYSACGQVQEARFEDGGPPRVVRYAYDERGHGTLASVDEGDDGTLDLVYTTTWMGDQGSMEARDGAGVLLHRAWRLTDARGLVVEEALDHDADEVWDARIWTGWTCE